MRVNWIFFTTGVLFLPFNVHALGKLITSETIVYKTVLVIFWKNRKKCFKLKYAANINLNGFFKT